MTSGIEKKEIIPPKFRCRQEKAGYKWDTSGRQVGDNSENMIPTQVNLSYEIICSIALHQHPSNSLNYILDRAKIMIRMLHPFSAIALKHIETYWNILKHIETYWNILKHIETAKMRVEGKQCQETQRVIIWKFSKLHKRSLEDAWLLHSH